MADLVGGVGASHSPMVSLSAEQWLAWGLRDHRHPMLKRADGSTLSYDEVLAETSDDLKAHIAAEIEPRACAARADRVEAALAATAAALAALAPDIVVVIGDDQDEQLGSDNLPPFWLYWGDEIGLGSMGDPEGLDDLQRSYLPAYREEGPARSYRVAADLALHLLDHLAGEGIDVAAANRLPDPEAGIGHAIGFPLRRLVPDGVPIVPVLVNTYQPPSQPRAARCKAVGEAIGTGIEAWKTDARVALVASGGLSHFVVWESFDRQVLADLEAGDLDAVCSLPEARFQAGTSEIKNWIVVGAACASQPFRTIDYVPGYRTAAGTGTGLAFGVWST